MSFTNEQLSEAQLPDYKELEITPLPQEAMWVAVISELIFLGVAVIVTIAGRFLNIPLFIDFMAYWISGVVIFTMLMMIWTSISYRYRGYAIREHDVLYKRGVIWQKITIVPFNRVQHVETQQGVLQRRFDLTTLNVFTAGGMRADLSIQGMDIEVTDGIKTMLLSRIQNEQFSDD